MSKAIKQSNDDEMLFSSFNYKILGLGLSLVIVGFTAMYLENEVEGFISLFISPILIVAGYIVVMFAIILNGKSTPAEESVEE